MTTSEQLPDETCAFCGGRGQGVCGSLPPDVCSRAQELARGNLPTLRDSDTQEPAVTT